MDRSEWIEERQHLALERMDTLHAPVYDENWGVISPAHAKFMEKFLELCPPNGLILDAACGTGKYWAMILARGRKVFGIDYSKGMLHIDFVWKTEYRQQIKTFRLKYIIYEIGR